MTSCDILSLIMRESHQRPDFSGSFTGTSSSSSWQRPPPKGTSAKQAKCRSSISMAHLEPPMLERQLPTPTFPGLSTCVAMDSNQNLDLKQMSGVDTRPWALDGSCLHRGPLRLVTHLHVVLSWTNDLNRSWPTPCRNYPSTARFGLTAPPFRALFAMSG